MIISKHGIKTLLDHFYSRYMCLPIDVEMHFAPNIQEYIPADEYVIQQKRIANRSDSDIQPVAVELQLNNPKYTFPEHRESHFGYYLLCEPPPPDNMRKYIRSDLIDKATMLTKIKKPQFLNMSKYITAINDAVCKNLSGAYIMLKARTWEQHTDPAKSKLISLLNHLNPHWDLFIPSRNGKSNFSERLTLIDSANYNFWNAPCLLISANGLRKIHKYLSDKPSKITQQDPCLIKDLVIYQAEDKPE